MIMSPYNTYKSRDGFLTTVCIVSNNHKFNLTCDDPTPSPTPANLELGQSPLLLPLRGIGQKNIGEKKKKVKSLLVCLGRLESFHIYQLTQE